MPNQPLQTEVLIYDKNDNSKFAKLICEDNKLKILGGNISAIEMTSGGNVYNQLLEKTITSAQIKAMNATPVQILPAPGPGKFNIIKSGVIMYKYGGAAYTVPATNDVIIRWQTANTYNLLIDYTTFAGITANSYYYLTGPAYVSNNAVDSDAPLGINDILEMKTIGTGEIATGTGDWFLRLFYDTIDVSTMGV